MDAYTRAHLAEYAALGGWLVNWCDLELPLMAGVPELLRLRRHLASFTGAAAVAAFELLARRPRQQGPSLAEAVPARLDAPWHCHTAMWSCTTHRELTEHFVAVNVVAAVPLGESRMLLARPETQRVRLWAVTGPLGYSGPGTAVRCGR